MEETFRTRKVKIKLISFDVGDVDIIVESRGKLLYYSSNNTSDELWESFNNVLKILSVSKKYRTARKWLIYQFTRPEAVVSNN